MSYEDREFFRVEFVNKKCEIELFKGYVEAIIKDISAKGMGVIVESEIPPQLFTNAYAILELDKEREIDIEMVKHEVLNPISHFYGLKFVGLKEDEENKILAYLLHEDIKRKNAEKESN